MYQLVIFDLDGTLLNTIADLANACNYALSQFGYPLHDEASYKKFVGNGIYKLVERSMPAHKCTPEHILEVKAAFDAYYKEHSLDETKPYEGIKDLLVKLKQQGIPCGVVTNKAHPYATELVKRFFGDTICMTLGQREGVPIKPHPHAVQEMMNHFNVQPNECLYIGDSNVDIQTAQAAKVTSVGVLWGFRDAKELRNEGADYLVHDTKALETIILENQSRIENESV